VCYTRNIGINNAKCDYIIFLDSDDELPVGALETYKKYIDSNEGPDIIIGGYKTVLKRRELNNFDIAYPHKILTDRHGINDIFWQLYKSNLLHNIGTKAYKKDLITKNSILFDTEISIYEDILFCLNVIKVSCKIITIPDIVYIYNIQENIHSLNHIYRKGIYKGMCRLYEAISELTVVYDDNYYKSFQYSLIETLYNEFRNKLYCYSEIRNLVRQYKNNEFILRNFYKRKCGTDKRVKLLYSGKIKKLYLSLLFKYIYEQFINMKIWSWCFDTLYYIYKKTIRNIIK
jgi:hypothetical protein